MELSILKKEEIQSYLDQTNLIAYADAFGKFALSVYESQPSFVGVRDDGNLKAFFPVFQRVYRGQKTAEAPLFIYTEIFFVDKNFRINGLELGRELRSFLKADVLRLCLYQLKSGSLQTDGLDHIFTAMITNLGGEANYDDFLKKVLSKNARSKIYKAYQGGLELVWLQPRDLSQFHRLYSAHAKAMGSKPHSLGYFQKMISAYDFGTDLFMLGTKKDRQLVSANLFIVNKDYMEVRFLADDNQFRHLFPNNFLYAEMIKWAIERGIRYIDFGGIPKNMRSNIEFKMSLGAKEYPIYTKYFFKNPWQKLQFKIGKKILYWKKYRQAILKKL